MIITNLISFVCIRIAIRLSLNSVLILFPSSLSILVLGSCAFGHRVLIRIWFSCL